LTEYQNTLQLEASQLRAVNGRVDEALEFLAREGFPLGVATVEHLWRDGSPDAVIEKLRQYQNPDGGFGRGLEVDISSPVSNPFAGRMAMHVLLALREPVRCTLVDDFASWLRQAQDEDGDWHFSVEVYAGRLAPWFQSWTFPTLNPACSVVGLATRLGISTPDMQERTARLFTRLASREEARGGPFYALLPYAEYLSAADFDNRAQWLDDLTSNIIRMDAVDEFADAGHFFDLVLPGGPELVGRLPHQMMPRFVDKLLSEQVDDGGWPTPYDPAWRPFQTTSALTTLARLRDGI
jgi:hypothetical protein